jgi:hypothetical protein
MRLILVTRLMLVLAIAAFCSLCHWTHPVDGLSANNPADSVVINEFMASNGTGVYLDENNEADDWIELYNEGKGPVSLKELSLSDDSTKLDKFALPDTILPSRGFVVIWADNQEKQGRLHAPFKLSDKNGDDIILTKGEKTIVDRIQFLSSVVSKDASYGRWTDGAATWAEQRQPTPGSANIGGKLD